MMPRRPRTVSDTPDAPLGHFGRSRGTLSLFWTLTRQPYIIPVAPEEPPVRCRCSQSTLWPFWTLPKCPPGRFG